MEIRTTKIVFPAILLQTRDAHKLRGFFGNFFKEKSPLLHNHFEDGRFAYRYPLVQYKVVDAKPMILGINEGADLLLDLFLNIKFLQIDEFEIPINSKNIETQVYEVDVADKLIDYEFKTLWMALNEKNFSLYKKTEINKRAELLDKIIQNNILSFYKGIGFWVDEKILAKGRFIEKSTKFKNQVMAAFEGTFITNAILPDFVGIGKAVSRGFGTVAKKIK